eukprot:2239609-Amphidinium_carterae.1
MLFASLCGTVCVHVPLVPFFCSSNVDAEETTMVTLSPVVTGYCAGSKKSRGNSRAAIGESSLLGVSCYDFDTSEAAAESTRFSLEGNQDRDKRRQASENHSLDGGRATRIGWGMRLGYTARGRWYHWTRRPQSSRCAHPRQKKIWTEKTLALGRTTTRICGSSLGLTTVWRVRSRLCKRMTMCQERSCWQQHQHELVKANEFETFGASEMSYGDFLCVCKLFNDLEEKASTEQLHVAKSIISGCSRLGLWSKNPELACILSHKIDGGLTEAVTLNVILKTHRTNVSSFAVAEAWCKARSGSYGPRDWLLGHRRLWEIILPVWHVDSILNAEESIVWTEHAESIDIIVKSCYLGEALFGFCLPQVLGALIEIELNKVKLEIAKCAVLDEATYMSLKNRAKAQVRTIGNISSLPERRQVKVQYRNGDVPRSLCG